jgi:hypothetical protein
MWMRLDHLADRLGVQTLVGKPHVLANQVALRRAEPTLRQAITAVQAGLDGSADRVDDEPLFVFSAAWRSGSTLLQRLIVSTERHFLWGEPYDLCDLIRRLADSLLPFTTGWPPARYMHGAVDVRNDETRKLEDRWIANLYPSVTTLIEGHRTLLTGLLRPPGGMSSVVWGMKEVRLSADHARYLRLLFPRARFIFLVRHPGHAYASYKRSPEWFDEWPARQVRTPRAFGLMWSRLAASFLDHRDIPRTLLLRYEDLVEGGESIARLEEILGASINPSVLANKVGSTNPGAGVNLGPVERRILGHYSAPVARALGYRLDPQKPPSGGTGNVCRFP